MLEAKIPDGPLEQKWSHYRSTAKLVSPANRKQLKVIVVGTGLSGSSLAASLGEMGYQVTCFCFQDTARRAHSVAAQGGVNACKNYKNDGDTVFRMFYDTIKGGDFRSREANVYRLAECSAQLIDQAVAQGVPFAREYSGYLSNRSFGGVQISRTFYARGQTGQQLLLGAYQALMRQVAAGRVQLFPRHELLDLVIIEGKARGIVVRNMDTGAIERHAPTRLCWPLADSARSIICRHWPWAVTRLLFGAPISVELFLPIRVGHRFIRRFSLSPVNTNPS